MMSAWCVFRFSKDTGNKTLENSASVEQSWGNLWDKVEGFDFAGIVAPNWHHIRDLPKSILKEAKKNVKNKVKTQISLLIKDRGNEEINYDHNDLNWLVPTLDDMDLQSYDAQAIDKKIQKLLEFNLFKIKIGCSLNYEILALQHMK